MKVYLCSKEPPTLYPHYPSGHKLGLADDSNAEWLRVTLPKVSEAQVAFTFCVEGAVLVEQWFDASLAEDKTLTGVLCDWLQDHRDLLLSGAVGPNPAERLEQVIEWFRQHFERGSYAHPG